VHPVGSYYINISRRTVYKTLNSFFHINRRSYAGGLWKVGVWPKRKLQENGIYCIKKDWLFFSLPNITSLIKSSGIPSWDRREYKILIL